MKFLQVQTVPFVIRIWKGKDLSSCRGVDNQTNELNQDEIFSIVKQADSQFSHGVKTKDSAMLVNIYADGAQFVQPKKPIISGKSRIGKDWADFMRLKENLIDLVLNIKSARGNKNLI